MEKKYVIAIVLTVIGEIILGVLATVWRGGIENFGMGSELLLPIAALSIWLFIFDKEKTTYRSRKLKEETQYVEPKVSNRREFYVVEGTSCTVSLRK